MAAPILPHRLAQVMRDARAVQPRDWPRFRVSRGDRITALAAYALVAMILGYFSAAYVGGGL